MGAVKQGVGHMSIFLKNVLTYRAVRTSTKTDVLNTVYIIYSVRLSPFGTENKKWEVLEIK
ncbi:MAG: hypothetical protein DDT33_01530 [Firmicutes bacterium]|nr:hypothetical protein [Bacillota bacterium]